MSTNLDALFGLAGEVVLQRLVGQSILRLLSLIDPALAYPSQLRTLVRTLHEDSYFLRDRDSRNLLFDLLSRQEAEALQELLDCRVTDDTYQNLKAVRIRKGSAREKDLLSFFSVAPPAELEVDQPALSEQEVASDYELFRHQRTAARKVRRFLATDPNRVLLHMPTGSGKTRTAMHVICDHLRSQEPAIVVWLAQSEELCEQAADEFETAWAHIGDRRVSVYRYWGDRSLQFEDVTDGLLIAGLGKLYEALLANTAAVSRLASRVSLTIMDEAHQAVAPTYETVITALLLPQGALLGLSATPGRTWNDIDADKRLSDFFSRRKVTLEIEGHSNPVDYLIAEGFLARPNFQRLFYSGGIELTTRDVEELNNSLDIPLRILRRLSEDEQRNLVIVQRIERLARDHRRIIVFAATVEHANVIASVLSARGIQSRPVTATTAPGERRASIEHFRGNDENPFVLCNFGVLTAGFDAPNTSAGVIARPTTSLVLYSQMVGRIIRGPLVGGSAEAEVVTIIDSQLPGFGDIGEAFLNWEDVWE